MLLRPNGPRDERMAPVGADDHRGVLGHRLPILAVALDLGYDSPSAFSAMFKREFGLPPSQYRASAGAPA